MNLGRLSKVIFEVLLVLGVPDVVVLAPAVLVILDSPVLAALDPPVLPWLCAPPEPALSVSHFWLRGTVLCEVV